jgi:endoribonuclease Dicer
VWCADRAALLLMIKIDKLKTREKYERHFLLLSLVFSLMLKVRKWCDDAIGRLTDQQRLDAFSRPKETMQFFFITNGIKLKW